MVGWVGDGAILYFLVGGKGEGDMGHACREVDVALPRERKSKAGGRSLLPAHP